MSRCGTARGWLVGAGAAVAFSLAGCGGSATLADDGQDDTPTREAPGNDGGGEGDGGEGAPSRDDSVELPQCEPGPERSTTSDEDCPWLTEGRCYTAREAACACACPDDQDSTCVSGSPYDGQVALVVSCF